MNNTYRDYIRKQNQEKFFQKSQDRFLNIAETKLKTAFIGALYAFEQEFGYLWGHGEEQPTVEQQEMRKRWDKIRDNILNNGNNQIRGLKKEAELYNIEYKGYHYDFQVRR